MQSLWKFTEPLFLGFYIPNSELLCGALFAGGCVGLLFWYDKAQKEEKKESDNEPMYQIGRLFTHFLGGGLIVYCLPLVFTSTVPWYLVRRFVGPSITRLCKFFNDRVHY